MSSKKKIIVVSKEEEKISSHDVLPQYLPNDEYYLYDYLLDCSKAKIEAKTQDEAEKLLLDFVLARVPRFFRIVIGAKRLYFAKLNEDDPFCCGIDIDKHGWYGGVKSNGIRIKYESGTRTMEYLMPPFYFISNCNKIMSQKIVDIPYHLDEGYSDYRKFNTFRGFKAVYQPDMTLEEAEKICKPLLDHIFYVLADGKEIIYIYILEWLMFPFRELKKTDIMITLIGPQGIGKTILFDFLAEYVVGEDLMSSIVGLEHITGTFNSALQGKIFLCINECVEVGEAKGHAIKSAEILKEIITGKKVGIRKMRENIFFTKNYINIALTTNSECPLIIKPGDRRNFITATATNIPGEEEQDEIKEIRRKRAYYNRIAEYCNQKVGNAFYTMARKSIPKCDLKNIPSTQARENAIAKSMPKALLYLDEVFTEGTRPLKSHYLHITKKEKQEKECFITTSDLYVGYTEWHRETNNGVLWSADRFSKAIKDCAGVQPGRKRIKTSSNPVRGIFILKSLHETITVAPFDDMENTISLSDYMKRK